MPQVWNIFLLIFFYSQLLNMVTVEGKTILYVGSYTHKPPYSDGWLKGDPSKQSIRAYQLNSDSSLTLLKEYGPDYAGKNAIYMTTTKNGDYLYVVNSNVGDGEQSDITAFKINKTNNGELTKINSYIGTGGENAVHISLDQNENFIFVAHYSGNGALSVFRRNSGGSIGTRVCLEKFQKINDIEPHLHSAYSFKNKYIYIPDLGSDLILNYELNPTTNSCFKNPNQYSGLKSTKGPRHMAFHPNGLYAYILNELSSQIHILSANPVTGKLDIIQDKINTLQPGVTSDGQAAAAIRVSPDDFINDYEKFLFVSNRRTTNSISVYRILLNGSALSYVGTYDTHGEEPRDFFVLKDKLVVTNQNTATIVVFNIGIDGSLTKSFGPEKAELPLAVVSIEI